MSWFTGLARVPVFVCLLLTAFLFGPALLLGPALLPTASAQENSGDSLCVVLALDASGSMESNDAQGMRFTAARLFVALLDSGDRVGLVQFSTGSQALTEGLVAITGPGDKTALIQRLAPTPPGGYTDVKAGLSEAAAMLNGAQGCGARTVVLLTDGKPEIEAHYAGYEDEALDVARQLGVPVMSIALTAAGETPFLLQLAEVTDPPGAVLPAADATALLDAYLDVLVRLKDRTLAGSGSAQSPDRVSLPLDPALAPYVEQASFIVSLPSGITPTLIAPDGTPLAPDAPNVRFSLVDPRFAVYTVAAPTGGEWLFQLEGAGLVQARAVLRSRLRVLPLGAGAYHPLGQPLPIVANLIEQAEDGSTTTIIGEASFSALIQRPDGSREALDLLYDDGTHGDALAGDGDFTALYVNTNVPGVYEITLNGHKGVIPVTGRLRVSIAPFPALTVQEPQAGLHEIRDQPIALGVVLSAAQPPTLDQGQFVAHVATPDGGVDEVPLVMSDDGTRYSGSYQPGSDGDYSVSFVPVGASYLGLAYEAEAVQTFSAVLIPTVAILDQEIDLGTVAQAQLARGLSTRLAVSSTGGKSEPVTVSLAGVPGLLLADVQPTSLAPNGTTTLLLTVQSADLAPGDYEASLIVAARDGVDMARRELPLRLSVYRPVLTLTCPGGQCQGDETEFDLGAIRADRLEGERRVRFTVSSTSLQDEELRAVAPDEWEDFVLGLSPTAAPAASSELELTLALPGGLESGDYQVTVQLLAREDVTLTPETLLVSWSVQPVPWTARYGLALALAGALLLALLVIFGVWRARILRPWGVLVPCRVPAGALELEYRLHQSDWRGRVLVGSAKGCQVSLVHPSIRPQHALILAQKQTVTEPVGRPPRPVTMTKPVCLLRNLGDGMVQVGAARLLPGQTSPPLKRGTRVRLGEFEFEWKEA